MIHELGTFVWLNCPIPLQYLECGIVINPSPSNAAYMHRWTGQHWFGYWLVTCLAPGHCRNNRWLIVNWVNWLLRNKLWWNFNQNTKFSSTKMHLNLSSVKWWPFCLGGDELTLILLNLETARSTLKKCWPHMLWCHSVGSHQCPQ